jgi:hypothetical protein
MEVRVMLRASNDDPGNAIPVTGNNEAILEYLGR